QVNDRAVYYALAALQAASGKYVEATQSLQTGLNVDEFETLDARAWSTYAAITNAYGLTDDARTALAKAAAADNSGDQEKLAAEYATKLTADLPAKK
ncbi:MAG TPA: hypothetical protein VFB63_20595, partial [Bryobacteraceae bacterium]|nr:hypothetical protein [Bryobacteraceae bacterium]